MILILAQAWEHRAKLLLAACIGIFAFAKREHEGKLYYKAMLAARPVTVATSESKESSREERGRVRIVKKYLPAPNCEGKPQLAEEIVEKDPVVLEKNKSEQDTKTETPVAIKPERVNRWLVGASFTPQDVTALPIVRVGHSWGNTLDLSYGYAAQGVGRYQHLVEFALRF